MDLGDFRPLGGEDAYPVEPQQLVFSEHAFPFSGTTLKWDPSKKELRLVGRYDSTGGQILPAPTKMQWKAFWMLLDHAKVWDWQSEYVDPCVCDGGGGDLDLSFRGRSVKSSGTNAFPDAYGQSYLPGSQFDVFCTAVSVLTGGKFPNRE